MMNVKFLHTAGSSAKCCPDLTIYLDVIVSPPAVASAGLELYILKLKHEVFYIKGFASFRQQQIN